MMQREGRGLSRQALSLYSIISNVVKAEPEGEPKRASGHGSHGWIGRTDGRTDDVIVKENYLTFKYTLHINVEIYCDRLVS